jgi:hypothetical protein
MAVHRERLSRSDDDPSRANQPYEASGEECTPTVGATQATQQPSPSTLSICTNIISSFDASDGDNMLQVDALGSSARRTLQASFTCNKCGVIPLFCRVGESE